MSKKILIFYLLSIFLINVSLVIAYHGSAGSGDPISLSKAVIIIIGTLAAFILIIWFFRKASMSTGKKKND